MGTGTSGWERCMVICWKWFAMHNTSRGDIGCERLYHGARFIPQSPELMLLCTYVLASSTQLKPLSYRSPDGNQLHR